MTDFQKDNSIPKKRILTRVLNSFSRKQIIAFTIFFLALVTSTVSMLGRINKNFIVYLPENGGKLTEGIVSAPRFLNPVLALSDTDRDISGLIYSGLMKKMPDGSIVNDLAESYTVSPDNLTYTFRIKDDAKFHDNSAVTAQDIIFTVGKIKDSTIKSPLQAVWQGVLVEEGQNNPRIVVFKLSSAYSSFLDNVTVGILPKHIWESLDSEEFNLSKFNMKAIGAGPYKISNIAEKKNGLIEEIDLTSFNNYAGEKPFIRKINFKFFKNEADLIKAYRRGKIDQISSIDPASAKKLMDQGFSPTTAVLSRIFGLFLNPNQNNLLRDKDIVQAIELGIDKEKIVQDVLYGFGVAITSPIPKSLAGEDFEELKNINVEENRASAEKILDNKGWKKNESGIRTKDGKKLSFSISTADVNELRGSAESIKEDLALIGIEVNVKIFEIGILNQNIIRPRDYEALLFGEVVRNQSDLFAFWHSSQRNDPGLNVAVYTNSKVDKLLEELIGTTNESDRKTKLQGLETQIKEDRPAIFLYSPEFIYMESPKIKNVELDNLTSSSERFLGVSDWYIREDAVWNFWPKQKID